MTEQNTALAASAPSLARLLAIMARLRDPQGGCEWDLAQDFASIAPYTIEEAYEVADAIERNDLAALREELGDLLLQVVFHSRMAEEAGHFAFDDVAAAIADKMEDRHPHIFGGEDDQGQSREERWENRKEAERAAKGHRARWTGGARPARTDARGKAPEARRARRLRLARHRRAGRQGDRGTGRAGQGRRCRRPARRSGRPAVRRRQRRAGLWHRPEDALRHGNAKFERRFRAMEALAGGAFASLDLASQEALWQAVKQSERGETADIGEA
jgi:ATP diphosphatase